MSAQYVIVLTSDFFRDIGHLPGKGPTPMMVFLLLMNIKMDGKGVIRQCIIIVCPSLAKRG
jgi:hypothetical protein